MFLDIQIKSTCHIVTFNWPNPANRMHGKSQVKMSAR